MNLYRFEDGWKTTPWISTYTVVRETAKCYVLDYYGKAKFILKNPGGRRFAYADLAYAKNSYRRRKERQIQHCQNSIDNARVMLANLDKAIEPRFHLETSK